MELDSARSAKAEIFEKAFSFVARNQPSARTLPLFGIPADAVSERSRGAQPPIFKARGLATAEAGDFTAGEINLRIAPPVAIGIRPGPAGRNELLLIGSDRRLARHPVVEHALALARGEARFVLAGRNRRLSIWQPAQRRPLVPGISIAHVAVPAGTLGGFVETDEGLAMLSNNHVLADVNRAALGDPILQPGRRDGGAASDAVGHLLRFVPIDTAPGSINLVDCAIASVDPALEVSRMHPDGIGAGAPPIVAGPADDPAFIDDEVHKVGRTTGLTRGRVFAVEVDNYVVNMGTAQRPLFCRFDNQFQVYAEHGDFARPGDSGSLVADREGRALGLLFAGSARGGPTGGGLAAVSPIGEVLAKLDTHLWMG